MDDLPALADLPALGSMLRQKVLSPTELVRRCLARIERLDPLLRAFIEVRGEQAMAEAVVAERELADGMDRGPLHGMPYGVKDIVAIRGWRTTAGSRALGDGPAVRDAVVVERLREAGAILLGTLNTHELQMGGAQTFPFGLPRNPWRLDRQPGGSSSGSAIAVAAGLCAFSLGGDTGGSVRAPAAYCGVVGVRPTWGTVPMAGVLPAAVHLDTLGPLTRTVGDAALVLAAMRGEDGGRPAGRSAAGGSPQGRLDGLRIGIVEEMVVDAYIEEDVTELLSRTVMALERHGAVVSTVSLPLIRHSRIVHPAVVDPEVASAHAGLLRDAPQLLQSNTRVRMLAGAALPAHLAARAMKAEKALAAQVLAQLETQDVLVGATTGVSAPPIQSEGASASSRERALEALAGAAGTAAQMCRPFSFAGVPAMSVPVGLDAHGIPVGLQIASRRFEEATMFRVGQAVEREVRFEVRPLGISRSESLAR